MRFLKILLLLISVCYSAVFAVDNNTNLPNQHTLNDRQQKIMFARAKNQNDFIQHVSDLHLASINVPNLNINHPIMQQGHPIQSYFQTSDMKIVHHYIQRVIHHALQPDQGNGHPQHAIVTTRAPNIITIECNLRNSGDMPPYFTQQPIAGIGGFGMNVLPDAAHPNGGLTDSVLVVIQRTNLGGWKFRTAYPVGYN